MNKTYRNWIMYALYAMLFVTVIVLQTVIFGDRKFFGVKISLIPVVIVCIAMRLEHEPAAFFSLGAGLFWQLSGADGGSLAIVTLPVIGILTAWLFQYYYAPRLPMALLFSVGAVLIHEGSLFLIKCYLEQALWSGWLWVPLQAALAVPVCLVLYLPAKWLRKAGAA